MIEKKTVFVLGAGSSVPYGYPTGKGLRENIYKQFKGLLLKYLTNPKDLPFKNDKDVWIKQANEFSSIFFNSGIPSIDKYLNINKEYKTIGKLAILCCILDAEGKSQFAEDIEKNDRKYDWYSHLYERLTEDISKSEHYKKLAESKINFITFNYDRSLEYFLYHRYINTFKQIKIHTKIQNGEEKINKVFPFKFLHVYGKIAPLQWQDKDEGVSYKQTHIPFSKLIKNIKVIYDEREDDDSELKQIKEEITTAERVFFLGFGFTKENLEILDIPNCLNSSQTLFATGYGLTERNINKISNIFKSKNIHIGIYKDWDSTRLLEEFL